MVEYRDSPAIFNLNKKLKTIKLKHDHLKRVSSNNSMMDIRLPSIPLDASQSPSRPIINHH